MSAQRLVFGLDIGGTRMKCGLIDASRGTIKAFAVKPTETHSLDTFLTAVDKTLVELCHELRIERSALVGCGAGIPGYVDGDFISMVWESLAFMEGFVFRAAAESRLGLPVRMDNDARVIALGEAQYGDHGELRRMLSLTLGTGLGFGMIVDGRLQERSSINHLAGHIPIRPDGRACFCGFRGCLEAQVNASALEEHFRRLSEAVAETVGADVDARNIFEMAGEKQPSALRAVEMLVDDLIVGLNAYLYLFGPEVIVLGGGLAQQLGPWLGRIHAGLFAKPYEGYTTRVCLSALKEEAGLYGAASLWS